MDNSRINMASFLTFDSCCGCISLRTGSFIIGYTYLVIEIIIGAIYGLGMVPFVTGVLGTDVRDEEIEFMTLLAFLGVSMLLSFISLGFIIALLVGLHKNKRGPVLAYLVTSVVFFIIDLVTFCAACAYHMPTITIVFRVICLVLQIVFFLVIRSYYLKMETDKGAMINTA